MDGRDFPTSVLTDRQRAFLRGESDITPSGERSIRQNIRERLHASIFDISLIVRRLSLDDIDKAFEEPVDPELGSPQPLAAAIPDVIALLYIAYRDDEVNKPNTHDGWFLESNVETGILNALGRLELINDGVDVSIDIERGEPLDALENRELSTLSRDELKQLLFAGVIDSDEFAEAISAKQD